MQQKIETAGLGQTFQMKCPKHKEEQLRSSKIVKVRAAGSAAVTRDPLFYFIGKTVLLYKTKVEIETGAKK